MTYQVLARKWRPKNFDQVIGQDTVVKTLTNAFNQNRLHHAYLLTGTRGVGKTTLGRIITKCLNCETAITALPCGQCTTCLEIEQGNFIDLFEIDAASRTKVEDTHALLDNVPYAPHRGRYKIYLIDEVHMLSGHSFNALLKTLEEPPEHVKFILATTDPQKLPITILSRCLQFHLRNLLPDEIAKHLEFIVKQENISYEYPALQLLARAAEGSMRDALSLLDQAIAFCNTTLSQQEICQMLGFTDLSYLFSILDALTTQEADKLIQISHQLSEKSIDYHHVLTEFLSLLHQLAWTQQYSELTDNESIQTYAKKISKEDVQLFYQIALIGKRDLPLAPTPQIGFEMLLLRMMTFKPIEPTQSTKNLAPPKNTIMSPIPPISSMNQEKIIDWKAILPALQLSGVTKILAANCAIKSIINNKWILYLTETQSPLLNSNQIQRLQKALSDYFNQPIQLSIEIKKHVLPTPAQAEQMQKQQEYNAAVSTIMQDQNLQNLLKSFNAQVDPTSITPIHTSINQEETSR